MDKISKFVINLKKRPDRLKLFSDSFPLTDFQIVYGFNGKDHKDESEKEIQIYNTFKIINDTINNRKNIYNTFKNKFHQNLLSFL